MRGVALGALWLLAGAVALFLVGLLARLYFERRRARRPAVAPPAISTPDCWKHERITLKMGRGVYTFRTLSFGDAIEVWRHVPALIESVKAGDQAGKYLVHAVPVIRTICPSLLMNPHDLKAGLNKENVALLWEWYVRQDWQRMTDLADGGGQRQARTGLDDPEVDNRTVFMTVAARAAETLGMDVPAFLDARFEFAADAIIALRKGVEKQEHAEGKTSAQAFAATSAAMFGSTRVNSSTAPEWLKAIVSHATGGKL